MEEAAVPSEITPGSGGREGLLREVRRRAAVRRHRRHRRIATAASVLVAATAVVVVLAVQPGHSGTSIQVQSQGTTSNRPAGAGTTTVFSPPTFPPGSGGTAPATSTTTAPASAVPAGAVRTASLPVVTCPTTFGVTPFPRPIDQPTSLLVSVPGQLADRLSIYVDDQGTMSLVGPRGWVCRALYGADGSGGVAVYPSGESVPSGWTAGWPLPGSSGVQAIIGLETSACIGCQLLQACPVFSSAAKAFQSYFGFTCRKTRPSSETVEAIAAGLVAFSDPPGVAGDGVPSGGQSPAHGVMTYYPGDQDGSWLATCTLPAAERDMCTVSLNHFVSSYGTR